MTIGLCCLLGLCCLHSAAGVAGEDVSLNDVSLNDVSSGDVSSGDVSSGDVSSGDVSPAEQLFALKVRPLLIEKCLACHGRDPDDIGGAFDLRSRESLLVGGETFGAAVVVPGNANASRLYRIVERTEPDFAMPPKESERLSEEQIWWIRDWINGGAPWPDDKRVAEIYERFAEGVRVVTSGGLSDEWTLRKYKPEDLWAWQPLRTDTADRLQTSADNLIDGFIDEQLESAGLTAAGPADRRTLIRRATFDLHGLPPDSAAVEAFVNNERSDADAFAALVDSLLASPRYGEQWGRHWLDVVRYADSSGFANDWERPNAWRYRDYVIRAFNDDKPYDQFIQEQLAGDELYEASLHAGGRPSPELLIAAGFLRMGPWEQTGMSVEKVTRQMFLDDITDSVGQVFLGHALQCCRCHDHKFDPIPTRDYYSIQSIFATTQFVERDAPFLPEENLNGMDEDRHYHQLRNKATAALLSTLNATKRRNEREWFKQRGLDFATRQEAVKAGFSKDELPRSNLLMTPDDFGQERIARKWQQRFPWEADRYKPIAFTVYNGKTINRGSVASRIQPPNDPAGAGEFEQTSILTGGDPFAAAAPVMPGVLSAVQVSNSAEFAIPTDFSGRRSALAAWIVSPSNPLAARVMANRVWHYHFGRGIAGNPNNFGATGKKPTHPELLDGLAQQLATSHWSIKTLQRTIMNSQTYRRSSMHPDPARRVQLDSSGRLYSVFQPRRLDAEELRDAMLAVSGELNLEMGGIPVRPDMNPEAALQPRMIMGTFAPAYVPNPRPEQRNRRSIYAIRLRGHRDPFMETFNAPGPDKSCEIRDSSTVTPQALTLMNNQESTDRAIAFAASVIDEATDDRTVIDVIYRRAFGRAATDDETAAAMDHWKRMEALQSDIIWQPAAIPVTVERRANEENTGETFTFTEELFANRDYIPDLQPHQVDARTRGLADLCLAILNSNEFIYVY